MKRAFEANNLNKKIESFRLGMRKGVGITDGPFVDILLQMGDTVNTFLFRLPPEIDTFLVITHANLKLISEEFIATAKRLGYQLVDTSLSEIWKGLEEGIKNIGNLIETTYNIVSDGATTQNLHILGNEIGTLIIDTLKRFIPMGTVFIGILKNMNFKKIKPKMKTALYNNPQKSIILTASQNIQGLKQSIQQV